MNNWQPLGDRQAKHEQLTAIDGSSSCFPPEHVPSSLTKSQTVADFYEFKCSCLFWFYVTLHNSPVSTKKFLVILVPGTTFQGIKGSFSSLLSAFPQRSKYQRRLGKLVRWRMKTQHDMCRGLLVVTAVNTLCGSVCPPVSSKDPLEKQ